MNPLTQLFSSTFFWVIVLPILIGLLVKASWDWFGEEYRSGARVGLCLIALAVVGMGYYAANSKWRFDVAEALSMVVAAFILGFFIIPLLVGLVRLFAQAFKSFMGAFGVAVVVILLGYAFAAAYIQGPDWWRFYTGQAGGFILAGLVFITLGISFWPKKKEEKKDDKKKKKDH